VQRQLSYRCNNPQKASCLSNLGSAQKTHYDCLGNLSDLENAILKPRKKQWSFTGDGHPDQPIISPNLGSVQHTRLFALGIYLTLKMLFQTKKRQLNSEQTKHPDQPNLSLRSWWCSTNSLFFTLATCLTLRMLFQTRQKQLSYRGQQTPTRQTVSSNLGLPNKLVLTALTTCLTLGMLFKWSKGSWAHRGWSFKETWLSPKSG